MFYHVRVVIMINYTSIINYIKYIYIIYHYFVGNIITSYIFKYNIIFNVIALLVSIY